MNDPYTDLADETMSVTDALNLRDAAYATGRLDGAAAAVAGTPGR